MSGRLIVFEGCDGTGKSLQARLLAEALRRAGVNVLESAEPTRGPWGQKIRDALAGGRRLAFADEMEAFLEDRREHQDRVLRPALAAGRTVVLDRYFYSTIAYQGARSPERIADIERMARADVLSPDLVLVLDLDPAVAAERIGIRALAHGRAANAFERVGDQVAVRAIFKRLVREDRRLLEIDADRSIAAVQADVWGRYVGREPAFRLGICRTLTTEKQRIKSRSYSQKYRARF